MNKRIGIFGGTFNPVHNTHLEMANCFVKQCNLDFCYFVPAYISPFKTDSGDTFIVEPQHRLKMLELAIMNNPKFLIETYELDKGGISFTIDTIHFLRKRHPEAKFYLLIGQDQAEEFDKWKDYKRVAQLSKICIVNRNVVHDRLVEIFKKDNLDFIEIMFNESEISSTLVRERINNCEDISELVPEKVKEYIFEKKLFMNAEL